MESQRSRAGETGTMARVAAMLRESPTLSLAQRQPVDISLHRAVSRESNRLAARRREYEARRRASDTERRLAGS